MTEARAFWTVAKGCGEIRREALPPMPVGWRRVRTLASGISRGTEAIVFAGRVPESQHQAMRAPLMAGAFPFPVKYGYAAVGVEQDGQRVFVLHPHQDVFDAPSAMCVPLPDDLPTRRAVLAANMETALNICWDAAPPLGVRACVIGAGVLGLLVASLLVRLPAASVTVVDTSPARRVPAAALGVAFSTVPPADQELVVHTSGSEAGLRAALECADVEATIVEASWFADTRPSLPLGEAFHARRLRLVSSQVGAVAPSMRDRRSHAARLGMALGLLRDPAYDALLEADTPFEELPSRMPELLSSGLCHVVTY